MCLHFGVQESVYRMSVPISGLDLQLITFFSQKHVQIQVELLRNVYKIGQVQQQQVVCCLINVTKMHALTNLSTVTCFFYEPLTSTTSPGLIRLRRAHWSRQQPCSQFREPWKHRRTEEVAKGKESFIRGRRDAGQPGHAVPLEHQKTSTESICRAEKRLVSGWAVPLGE